MHICVPFVIAKRKAYLVQRESQSEDTPVFSLSPRCRPCRFCYGLRWIAIPCDQGNTDPSWMNMPTSNMVAALTARLVSEDYVEWGWFLFGLGVLLWLALWPITFRAVCTVRSVCALTFWNVVWKGVLAAQ